MTKVKQSNLYIKGSHEQNLYFQGIIVLRHGKVHCRIQIIIELVSVPRFSYQIQTTCVCACKQFLSICMCMNTVYMCTQWVHVCVCVCVCVGFTSVESS